MTRSKNWKTHVISWATYAACALGLFLWSAGSRLEPLLFPLINVVLVPILVFTAVAIDAARSSSVCPYHHIMPRMMLDLIVLTSTPIFFFSYTDSPLYSFTTAALILHALLALPSVLAATAARLMLSK